VVHVVQNYIYSKLVAQSRCKVKTHQGTTSEKCKAQIEKASNKDKVTAIQAQRRR